MFSVTLLHPEETFKIPTLQVMTKLTLFQKNPTLLGSPYRVQSPVSLSIFREFLSALAGNAINITDTNFTELDR
jgi:ABC-type glycerol-3-phosphate transport system permease component